MITIRAFKYMPINIGFAGEYDVRRVEFNLSHFEKELGAGNATILRRRPGDTVAYPAPLEKEGKFWYWYIKLEDTAIHGSGTAEVIYTPIDGGLAKSEFYDFLVDESLSESDTETPPAGQAYLDRVIAEVNKVTGMTAESVPLPAGSEPTAEYADGVLTIGIPLGGDVSEAQIAQAVSDYLAAHPIEETDPTVPDWARQPEKPKYTADEVGALSAETLPDAINTALAQAKESGKFDGADGKDGAPGADGGYYTPSVTQPDENTMRVSFTPSDSGMTAVQAVDVELPAGPKGDTGLTGDTGPVGPAGADGKDGVTPTRGVDYWTAADIAEIKSYVDDAILGGAW